MTVSTEISSNEYTGNGVTTDFDYKFRIFKANQLSVITSDADGDNVVTLRLGTDYTVTGANKSAGGKVILTKPLANGHKISIARDIPIKQETSFRNQSKFFAETHEDAFDYLTMLMQRIWGSLGSLYLKRPNILANWFDAKGYRIANLGKPKRDTDAVDLGTLKDEISGVSSTILKREKRLLRVDDIDIPALPKVSERRNKQIGFDGSGLPILLDPAETGALGYIFVDSFENGALITSRYQALHFEYQSEFYRWDGDLPKQVPVASTPQSTGGIGKGAWVSVGDASLRSDLSRDIGASIVKTKSGESVQEKIDSISAESALNDSSYSGDYNSIQEALDSTKVHGEAIVSPKAYTENVTLSNKNLSGFGDASTIMPYGNNAALLVEDSNPSWTYRYLTNLRFQGSTDIIQTGVKFDPDNSLSGRIGFSGISFNRLDKAIHKSSGNIGNTYQHISAGNINYFMYAEAKSNMHVGADTIQNSHFETIHKYAFYLDGKKENGGIGGFCIRDSIIEASNGGGLYVKSKGDTPITPILLSNVWFERMCNSPTVNVDSVEQKPQILKFIDNKIAYVEYSSINQIELINSNLVMYGCNFDNRDLKQSIVVDSNSSIICYDAFMNGAGHVDVIVESIAQQNGKINSVGLCMRGSNFVGRVNRPASGIVRQAVTFDKDQEYRFDGDKRTVGTRVSDGMLSEFCQEFDVVSGTNQAVITGLTTQITSGKWYAWGINAKKLAGDGRLDFLYGITLGSIYLKEGEWVRTFGYAQATRSDTTNIMVRTASSNLKFRLSDLFIVEFNTEREARLFSNSKVSISDM